MNKIEAKVRVLLRNCDAIRKVSNLRLEYAAELERRAMALCPHPEDQLINGEYCAGAAPAASPFRVCKLCGYAEDEQGSGYWKLAHGSYSEIKTIPREEAEKFIRRYPGSENMNKEKFPK